MIMIHLLGAWRSILCLIQVARKWRVRRRLHMYIYIYILYTYELIRNCLSYCWATLWNPHSNASEPDATGGLSRWAAFLKVTLIRGVGRRLFKSCSLSMQMFHEQVWVSCCQMPCRSPVQRSDIGRPKKVLVLLSARTWDLKCCILAVSSFGKHECEAICKADFLRQKIPMLDDVEYIDALIQYIM